MSALESRAPVPVPRSRQRRRTRSRLAAGASALVATVITGAGITLVAPTMADAAVLPNNFKSVGYMPSWSGDVNAIQYSKLTHINYAFVLPNANGSLQAVPDPNKLRSLVSLGHAANT